MKLRILPQATLDIAEQAFYYEEQADIALAERWEASVEAAIGSLRTFPQRGPLLNSERPSLRELRRLHIEGFPNHLLLYRFDSVSSTIFVIHVVHGARDIEQLLGLSV